MIEKLDEEEKRQKEEARLKRDKEEEDKRIRKLEEKIKKNKNRDKGKKQIEESKVKQTGESKLCLIVFIICSLYCPHSGTGGNGCWFCW